MATSTAAPKPAARSGFVATLKRPSFIFKLVFVVVLAGLAVLLQNTYDMSVMTTAGFFAMMVVAVSLILGQAGQLSFGHAAFYGIGAYTAAILATTYHWNTMLALLIGALRRRRCRARHRAAGAQAQVLLPRAGHDRPGPDLRHRRRRS